MQWLAELISQLFCWVPRLWLVNPDEGGVRVTLGNRYRATSPGWYAYWPLIQDCIKITVTPQIQDIRSQSVLTKDGQDMCIGGAVKYRVKDAAKALLKVQDYDETIQALVLGICSRYISKHDYDDCRDIADIESCVLKGIKEEARGWGLDVMSVFVTDLGRTKNIRILTDTPGGMIIEEEGE